MLKEARDWLIAEGIPNTEAESALPRALRDEGIRTRCRTKDHPHHSDLMSLNSKAWDQVKIHWPTSSIRPPDRDGEKVVFYAVEVFKRDLSKWFSENNARPKTNLETIRPTDDGNPRRDEAGRKPALKADIDAEYVEHVKECQELTGRHPTIKSDEEWRRSKGLNREKIRELRRRHRSVKEKKGGHPKGAKLGG